VAAAFVSGAWSRGSGAKRVKVVSVADVDALLAQAAGCLRGVAAAVGLRDGNGEVVSARRALVALRDHIERVPERWVEGVSRSMLSQRYGSAA
jgi:peroxiredoxin